MAPTFNLTPVKADGIIFDMDGTLWDAVDQYAHIWNVTFKQLGIDCPKVTRQQLIGQMGRTLDKILADICPGLSNKDAFLNVLYNNEHELMPRLAGTPYPGMLETIKALSTRYPLFIVSNCAPYTLRAFNLHTGIGPYIKSQLSHGETGLGKAQNIQRIIKEYDLANPWYVGDTQYDLDATRQAGAHYVQCLYGFGTADNPDREISDISQLSEIFPL